MFWYNIIRSEQTLMTCVFELFSYKTEYQRMALKY